MLARDMASLDEEPGSQGDPGWVPLTHRRRMAVAAQSAVWEAAHVRLTASQADRAVQLAVRLVAARRPGDTTVVQVLGPLEVRVGDHMLDVGGTKIRTLLAMLVANAGRVTTVGTLVAGLWGDDEPPSAHRSVRTYVSRLRQSLTPAGDALTVVTHPAGYVLRMASCVLDAMRFEESVAVGRQALADEPAVAVERLTHALSLWHGDAYGEFGGVTLLRAAAGRLHEMRLLAVADQIDARLAVGAGAELVAELTGLTEQHPGHDRLWGQLMRALYRAGRQADALQAFARARTVLVERFGLDPSPSLVELHGRVLENDDRLVACASPGRSHW